MRRPCPGGTSVEQCRCKTSPGSWLRLGLLPTGKHDERSDVGKAESINTGPLIWGRGYIYILPNSHFQPLHYSAILKHRAHTDGVSCHHFLCHDKSGAGVWWLARLEIGHSSSRHIRPILLLFERPWVLVWSKKKVCIHMETYTSLGLVVLTANTTTILQTEFVEIFEG
jgi:hypothetical protein